MDFAEVLDYVSALKSRIDDFFDYLSAHTKSL